MRRPLRIRSLDDGELVALARTGHRRAEKLLAARLHPRVARLAAAIAGDPEVGTSAARDAFSRVLESQASPFAAAVVTEAQRLAVDRRPGDGSRLARLDPESRAAVVACDLEGMTTRVAAAELGVDRREVIDWLERGRQALGAPPPPDCAGWQLVCRYDDLGVAERRAAEAHLDLCVACREARASRQAIRRDLRRALPAQAASLAGGAATGAILGGSVPGLAASVAATLAAGLVVVSGLLGSPDAPAAAVPDDRSGAPPAAVESEEVAVEEDVDSGGTPTGSVIPPASITDPPLAHEGDDGGTFDDPVPDVDDTVDDTTQKIGDTAEEIEDTVDDTTQEIEDTAQDLQDTADDTTQDLEGTVDDTTQEIHDTVQEIEDTVPDEVAVQEVDTAVESSGDATTEAVDDTLDLLDDADDTIAGIN